LHCYVIHFGLFASSRRRQVELLIQSIRTETPPEAPLIIAGDFNDWRDHLSATLRQQLGVEEVFEYARKNASVLHHKVVKHKPALTFPVGAPFLPLDRIYVRDITVRSANVLQGKPWLSLSDHAPVTADLEL
jgi:endonuclease/exonuclease/phosphatase family metal-dependent hydrolase